MIATKNKITINWILLILTLVIGILSIIYVTLYAALLHSEDSARSFESYVIDIMKETMKVEVENRINEIEYDLKNIKNVQESTIKEKILFISNTLINSNLIYIENINIRKQETIKLYEKLVMADDEYLYFIMEPTGILLRSGTDNTINGINFINDQDKNGFLYAKEMVKSKYNPNGVYVSYYWPKVKNGEPLKKISYCYYIEQLDLIIGTGVYDVDTISQLKDNIYSRFNNYYRNRENYLFILDYSGKALVHGDSSLIGKNLNYILDINGKSVADNMLNIVKTDGEGFTSYPFKLISDDVISEKISFVKNIEGWDAYIGMGFNTDNLEEELLSYIEKFESEHIKDLTSTFILFIILAIVMFYLIKRGIKLQGEFLKQEELLFEKLFKLSPDGIFVISKTGSVLYQNSLVDKLMDHNLKNYVSSNGSLIIPIIKDNIFKIINRKNRVYYIEFLSEKIIYHGIDGFIYFIRDITNDYIESNKLLEMALNDQLTKLPNRHKLSNDLEDLFTKNSSVNNIIFTIIDLDNFKLINDTYGHDIGDKVLITLAETFLKRLRDIDNIYRYGGEEFIVILKNITLNDGINVLNNINEQFKDQCQKSYGFNATFSGGIVTKNIEDFDSVNFNSIFKEVDELLYKAKNNGRNRVEF